MKEANSAVLKKDLMKINSKWLDMAQLILNWTTKYCEACILTSTRHKTGCNLLQNRQERDAKGINSKWNGKRRLWLNH